MFANFLKESSYTPAAWLDVFNWRRKGIGMWRWYGVAMALGCPKLVIVAMSCNVLNVDVLQTQGDSGNFLKHWNCKWPCTMPPSIAKEPVVFVAGCH